MDNTLSKIVGQRINAMLAERNKKQKELAAKLNVTDNTVSYYCSGTRLPNTSQIKKIAEFLDCSADYLLGLVDQPTTDKDISYICEYTGLSLKAIDEFHQLIKIKEYIDLSTELKTAWINEGIIGYTEVQNQFIESGYMRRIIGLAADYFQSMKLTIDTCNTLIGQLGMTLDRVRFEKSVDLDRFDPFELNEVLANRKEIRLHYYEAQDLIREFFKNCQKEVVKKYNAVTEKYDEMVYEYEEVLEKNEEG